MKRWLERKSLSLADHIIAVSEAAGRLFAAKAGTRAGRVLVVRNGIDIPASPAGPFAPGPTTRITYLGNLYHRRDPRPLMRALAALRRSGEVGNRPVELAFYGQCRWYHDVSLEQEALSLGIADWVSFHEPIPRAETAAVMASSDLLLLFAQEQPLQIPQKLYEYFAAQRPILAFADRDGETASMLEAAGGHFVIHDEDPDQVRAVLARALRGEPDSASRFDPLLEWSTAREFGRLVAALTGLPQDVPAPHLSRERDSSSSKGEVRTTTGQ
jgi:glycosyltransferase involved in cell wall biosynthesis